MDAQELTLVAFNTASHIADLVVATKKSAHNSTLALAATREELQGQAMEIIHS